MIKTMAVVYNARIPEAEPLAHALCRLAEGYGCATHTCTARDVDRRGFGDFLPQLVVTLGGDGTILRAARASASLDALILGVNLGQLGFLAELGPDTVTEALPRILHGEGWVEERMLLRVDAPAHTPPMDTPTPGDPAPPQRYDALNDAVVSRGALPRAMRVEVHLDGRYLTTYVADGVIVSTPTGSTAYSLAMQGPIIHPEMRTILLTPIAPHLTVVRALVLPPTTHVQLTVHTEQDCTLSIDGQLELGVHDGDVVVVTASERTARFIRLRERTYFYQTLVERLSTTIARGMP